MTENQGKKKVVEKMQRGKKKKFATVCMEWESNIEWTENNDTTKEKVIIMTSNRKQSKKIIIIL